MKKIKSGQSFLEECQETLNRIHSGQTFLEECQETLNRIHANNPDLIPLSYFLNLAFKWHSTFAVSAPVHSKQLPSAKCSPVVVVLSTSVPEQLLYAFESTPLFITGGSHQSCAWSDEFLPRDSDPVSRSMLGYAIKLTERSDLDPLFVVPITNDNMRKIAYFLKRLNQKVCPVNFPPNKEDVLSEKAYARSIEDMMEAVAAHLKEHVSAAAIKKADKAITKAKKALLRFTEFSSLYSDNITSEAMLLVCNSYYYADDLNVWSEQIHLLINAMINSAIEKTGKTLHPARSLPKVLVMGSPILFPVYKVPDLIAHCGLSFFRYVDSASPSQGLCLTESEGGRSAAALIRTIAGKHYNYDASSAYVTNESMEKLVRELIDEGSVEGVVLHILKGHIEYDFELNRMEALFDAADIPVFRLETDYQYQDLEQLRIRLEAFGEMLNQRKIVRKRSGAVASKRNMHNYPFQNNAKEQTASLNERAG